MMLQPATTFPDLSTLDDPSADQRRVQRALSTTATRGWTHQAIIGLCVTLGLLVPPLLALAPFAFGAQAHAFALAWRRTSRRRRPVPTRGVVRRRAAWILAPWLGPHLAIGSAAGLLAHLDPSSSAARATFLCTLAWTVAAWAPWATVAGVALHLAALGRRRPLRAVQLALRAIALQPANAALVAALTGLQAVCLGAITPLIARHVLVVQAEIAVASIRDR